ncbi:MAG: metal ABC transporter substrate-binding protein [Pseudomonadales bacterium]
MRKMTAILFVLVCCVESQATLAKLNVLTCEPEWAALARELGGEHLKVFSATTGVQDPHRIQARPSLIAKARRADLLICSGAELEIGWLPILLRKTGNNKIQVGQAGHFIAADFVTMLGVPTLVDRSEGDIHATGNPHIHTNPHNISAVALALLARLQQLDSANDAAYQQRYADFKQRWHAAIARWEQQAAPLRDQPVVVQHSSWEYLAEWLGLRQVVALEPKPGIPPSGAHLARVLKQMQDSPAAMILYASYQDDKPARWLASKTGIPKVGLPYTVGGIPGVDDLFALFDQTIALLVEAIP